MQSDKLKNYLHLHFLVLIAGFTAILGELISIEAIPLVWYRMTIAGVLMFLFIKFKKMSLKVPLKAVIRFSIAGVIIALHWIINGKSLVMKLYLASLSLQGSS